MATLNDVDQDLISLILAFGKILHDHETSLTDWNVAYDSASGLKARLALLPKGGQDALDELTSLHGLTVQQLNDIAFIVTSEVQGNVTNGRTALASLFKVR